MSMWDYISKRIGINGSTRIVDIKDWQFYRLLEAKEMNHATQGASQIALVSTWRRI